MSDALATAYTGARPRLVRVAYSILGSLVEAEDVVPWLPELVVTTVDPIDRITLDESVRYALLVVLEQFARRAQSWTVAGSAASSH